MKKTLSKAKHYFLEFCKYSRCVNMLIYIENYNFYNK